jgi:hypothetical protein
MTEALPIGLSSWIVQDGNYPDFKIGQECAFALEFYAMEPLTSVSGEPLPEPRHIYKGNAQFEVVGRNIYAGNEWWAMDFGIPAYTNHARTNSHEIGALLDGSVYLGVDHFDYFERLSRIPTAPPLIFDWRVERIELQTAPFIKQDDRMLIRDPEKIGWRDLVETSAWEDDGGHSEYILHCTRLSEQPRHSLSR